MKHWLWSYIGHFAYLAAARTRFILVTPRHAEGLKRTFRCHRIPEDKLRARILACARNLFTRHG